MAAQWGRNSLAAGASANWYFVRAAHDGFLPVISVVSLTPSFSGGDMTHVETYTSVSFPISPAGLTVSTVCNKMTDDGQSIVYFLKVMNFSKSTIVYAFVEADL
jgi:hypothetical protein